MTLKSRNRNPKSALDNHRPLRIIAGLCTGVFNAFLPVLTQKVEAQAVCFGIDYVGELLPQFDPLGWVDETLENGMLDTLATIFAGLGHVAKTGFACFGFRIDVVGN